MITTNYLVGTVTSNPYSNFTFLNDFFGTDVYSLSISETQSLNINLHDIAIGSDLDLALYRDENSNGELDESDSYLSGAFRSGNEDDGINYQTETGDYLIEVYPFSFGSNESIDYSLDISATPFYPTDIEAPNLLSNEENLGQIYPGEIVFADGYIYNENTSDMYGLSVGSSAQISVFLSGLTSDVDVRLISDRNNNNIADPEEVVMSSTQAGSEDEFFSASVEANESLYVQVYQYSASESSYFLEIEMATNSIDGDNNDNILRGTDDNDIINGNGGNDKLKGRRGDDLLDGGRGNDRLLGSQGDDFLDGGLGRDRYLGGRGADTFVFDIGQGFDTIRDFRLNEGDRISLGSGLTFDDLTITRAGRNGAILSYDGEQLGLVRANRFNTINTPNAFV